MPAITIRNLPSHVHDALRQAAQLQSVSVEGLARRLLAQVENPSVQQAAQDPAMSKNPAIPSGMAEHSAPWGALPHPVQSPVELWGALKGTAHVAAGTDLAAPLDEDWDALS